MGTGYWGKPEETAATFQNILKSRTNPSHAEGATDDATWVRTGDYGAFHDGELYITGRVKDLVIIDGRNHYPQDLEYSAQEASRALRTGFVAAFSVPANQLPAEVFDNAHAGLKYDPDDTSEQLVIVGERAPGAHKMDLHAGRRRHPCGDRGASRCHRARRAADPGGRDSAHLERQDRSPRVPCRRTSTAACAAGRSRTTSPIRRTDATTLFDQRAGGLAEAGDCHVRHHDLNQRARNPPRRAGQPRTDKSVAELRECLRNWIANATGQSADSIDESAPMVELGLSSRDAVAMASDIEDLTGVTLTATVAFRHPTIESLATVIVEGEPEEDERRRRTRTGRARSTRAPRTSPSSASAPASPAT